MKRPEGMLTIDERRVKERISFVATSGEHVYLSTDPRSASGEAFLVVNGIPVHAGIHLHLMGDGKWATAFRGEVHVTRRGMPGCGVTQKAGWIDESDPGIKLLNIEEDLCGRDQVTFRCSCGRENKSLRVG